MLMLSLNAFRLITVIIAEKNYYVIKFEKLYSLIDLIDIQKRAIYRQKILKIRAKQKLKRAIYKLNKYQ